MPKIKVILSLLVIVLAVALVGGATMAWFTAQASVEPNEFVAGTVAISANRTTASASTFVEKNWNPGDNTDLEICIENEGTKAINLRTKVEGNWIPSSWRILIVFSGGDIQLLVLDWDTAKCCTGSDGPVATANNFNFGSLGLSSYMDGNFSGLSDETWLQNGENYSIWCADSITFINSPQTNVKIFDPFCNENWFDEVTIVDVDGRAERWKNIPWTKIAYIINKAPEYLDPAGSYKFGIMDVQQAIWKFTNGEYATGQAGNTTNAQVIVDEIDAGAYLLPADNVEFEFPTGSNWHKGDDGWYYYNGILSGLSGSSPVRECFTLPVKLDPFSTGNEYQGAMFWLSFKFEAIQASNQASDDVWNMSWTGTEWQKVDPAP